MINNPFLESGNEDSSYYDYIRNILKDKKYGDTFEVDLKGNDLVCARASISNVAKKLGYKYRTRSKDGHLFV
jgi:hypothetical protein